MADTIVSPTGRSARVRKHFGFKKDTSGRIDRSKHAVCKLCNASVAHGGGTTNLQNHLCLNNHAEYMYCFICQLKLMELIVILLKWILQ